MFSPRAICNRLSGAGYIIWLIPSLPGTRNQYNTAHNTLQLSAVHNLVILPFLAPCESPRPYLAAQQNESNMLGVWG